MTKIRNMSAGLSIAFAVQLFTLPVEARAPVVPAMPQSFEHANQIVPVANKLQKALKGLKKTFKKSPQAAPSGPARQPGLNQIFDRNAVSAPNAPRRAPSQADTVGGNQSPYGSVSAANKAPNPYGKAPPPASEYDIIGAPQFPNGPYGQTPTGRLNQRPTSNNYGNPNAGVNGVYGSAPPASQVSNYDRVAPPQFPNGPYGQTPTGVTNKLPTSNNAYGSANGVANNPYGNIPRGQFPNGAYGNVPRGEFPNGPYGNVPTGQANANGTGAYAIADPRIFRDSAAGPNGVTSPGYQKFDTNLFKNPNGDLPAQIRRLPTQRFDAVAPANSPALAKQASEQRALAKGIARDGKIIKGSAAGIIGSGLILGGLGTAYIVDMKDNSEGNQNNE